MATFTKYMATLLLSVFYLSAFAQTDTTFWFAAPEVEGPGSQDRPIIVYITTYAQAATVTISQPAGGGMPTQSVAIAANSTQGIDLTPWITNIETYPENVILNYGLKIRATTPVTAYYDVIGQGTDPANPLACYCNPEIFVLKGSNAVGTDFWIPGQSFADNEPGYFPYTANAFDIVALQDNTTVAITPSHDIVGHTAGTTFSIMLNSGQTYSASGTSQSASQHLMGSRVTSDKPITINVKDDILSGANFGCAICADLAGDQIVPTNNLGTQYVAIKSELFAPYDQIFITATQNGTVVSQNGSVAATINAGDTYQISLGNAVSTYIQTSLPAYAYQLSGIGGELGSALLPPITCTGSRSVSFTNSTASSSSALLYINLLVPQGGQGNFLVNGVAGVVTAAQFSVVPGASNWYAAHIQLPVTQYPLGTVISVTNSTSFFQLGMLNGINDNGANFGYFSDYGVHPVIGTTTPSACVGSEIVLLADTIISATYTWSGPNGFTSTVQNPVIPNISLTDSGTYYLTVSAGSCSSTDSTLVQVHPLPNVKISASKDSIICTGTITLIALGASQYTWAPAAAVSDTTGAVVQSTIDTTTTYIVTGLDANQCPGKDTITVKVGQPLKPVVNNVAYCQYAVADTLTANGTILNWYTDTNSAPLSGPPLPNTAIPDTMYYYVNGQLGACVSPASVIQVIINPLPVMTATTNAPICSGQVLSLTASSAVPGISYSWSGPDGFSASGNNPSIPNADTTMTGIYKVVSLANGCTDSANDTVLVHQLPDATISAVVNGILCTGDSIQLVINYYDPSVSYQWAPADFFETPTREAASERIAVGQLTQTISLTASTVHGCVASDSLLITAQPCCVASFPNAFTPNKDGKNDVFRAITIGNFPAYHLMVVNRWGQTVFETYSEQEGWDGTYNGTPQDIGVYAYFVKYECNNHLIEQKGEVTLIR